MSEIHRNDLRKVNVIFVHSDIDDLGLSIHEFRIYAHIARRAGDGECFPSIPSIAKHCKCSTDTARETIHNLIEYKLIDRQERPGNSPLYRLTSVREWKRELVGTLQSKRNTRKRTKKDATPPDIRDGLQTPPDIGEGCGHRGGHPSGHRGGHPSGHRGDEVHPIELIQSEVIQITRKAGFHPEFIDGWCRKYEDHFSCKYEFEGGKDGNAVKALAKFNRTSEDLLAIAEYAWQNFSGDRFYGPNSKTIAGFRSNFNHFQTEAAKVRSKIFNFGLPE